MEVGAKSGKGRSDTPESRTSSLALQTHPKYYNSNYKAHPSTKIITTTTHAAPPAVFEGKIWKMLHSPRQLNRYPPEWSHWDQVESRSSARLPNFLELPTSSRASSRQCSPLLRTCCRVWFLWAWARGGLFDPAGSGGSAWTDLFLVFWGTLTKCALKSLDPAWNMW